MSLHDEIKAKVEAERLKESMKDSPIMISDNLKCGVPREELIEKYERRIQFLTERVMYLAGKCEGYKQFWKIWNGESEDEADE